MTEIDPRIEAAARAMWARAADEVSFDEAKAADDEPYQWTLEDARVALAAADAAVAGPPVTLTYTNWRGETADRTIIPLHVWFGATDWHSEPQWLLRAIDVEKNVERDFALKDFGGSASQAAAQDVAALRSALEFYSNAERYYEFSDDAGRAHYDGNVGSELGDDHGARARAALRMRNDVSDGEQ